MTLPVIVTMLGLAILYGITMKVADLLDEHGFVWFYGSRLIFGIFWGTFGSLLVISDVIIAQIVLAMTIAFLARNRLDYFNHQVAATIIFITFLATQEFDFLLFIVFYFVFLVFGSLRDYVGEKIKRKDFLQKIYDNFMWYYPVSALIYSLITSNWLVFWVFLVFTISYDMTKHYANREVKSLE